MIAKKKPKGHNKKLCKVLKENTSLYT